MGNNAAITVNVARIVGLPTSLTASAEVASEISPSIAHRRYIFSTTTMASSTRIPIEKIKANKLTRSMVYPIIKAKNVVTKITLGITIKQTRAARQFKNQKIKTVTAIVTSINLNIKPLTLS